MRQRRETVQVSGAAARAPRRRLQGRLVLLTATLGLVVLLGKRPGCVGVASDIGMPEKRMSGHDNPIHGERLQRENRDRRMARPGGVSVHDGDHAGNGHEQHVGDSARPAVPVA